MATCRIEGCEKECKRKDICEMHYYRFRRHGCYEIPNPRKNTTLIEKFRERYVVTDGCWEWIGAKDKNGYGVITYKTLPIKAHRYSFSVHYGEILEGMSVLHKCDNPSCVNPEHLFQGTQRDNMHDAIKKKRHMRFQDVKK